MPKDAETAFNDFFFFFASRTITFYDTGEKKLVCHCQKCIEANGSYSRFTSLWIKCLISDKPLVMEDKYEKIFIRDNNVTLQVGYFLCLDNFLTGNSMEIICLFFSYRLKYIELRFPMRCRFMCFITEPYVFPLGAQIEVKIKLNRKVCLALNRCIAHRSV